MDSVSSKVCLTFNTKKELNSYDSFTRFRLYIVFDFPCISGEILLFLFEIVPFEVATIWCAALSHTFPYKLVN